MLGGLGGALGGGWRGGQLCKPKFFPTPVFSGFYLQGELVLQPQMAWGGEGGLSPLSPAEVRPPPPRGYVCALGLEGVRIPPSVLA